MSFNDLKVSFAGKEADEDTKLSELKKFLFSSFCTSPAKFLAMERLEILIADYPDLNLWVLVTVNT